MRHMDPTREPTEQLEPKPRRPRPAVIVGPVIMINPAPTPAQQLGVAIERNGPCVVLGHRPAWLARGGVACGRCGSPM